MDAIGIFLDLVLGAGTVLLVVVVAGIVLFLLHLMVKEYWPAVAGILATVLLWLYLHDYLALLAVIPFLGIQIWWTKKVARPPPGPEHRGSGSSISEDREA